MVRGSVRGTDHNNLLLSTRSELSGLRQNPGLPANQRVHVMKQRDQSELGSETTAGTADRRVTARRQCPKPSLSTILPVFLLTDPCLPPADWVSSAAFDPGERMGVNPGSLEAFLCPSSRSSMCSTITDVHRQPRLPAQSPETPDPDFPRCSLVMLG